MGSKKKMKEPRDVSKHCNCRFQFISSVDYFQGGTCPACNHVQPNKSHKPERSCTPVSDGDQVGNMQGFAKTVLEAGKKVLIPKLNDFSSKPHEGEDQNEILVVYGTMSWGMTFKRTAVKEQRKHSACARIFKNKQYPKEVIDKFHRGVALFTKVQERLSDHSVSTYKTFLDHIQNYSKQKIKKTEFVDKVEAIIGQHQDLRTEFRVYLKSLENDLLRKQVEREVKKQKPEGGKRVKRDRYSDLGSTENQHEKNMQNIDDERYEIDMKLLWLRSAIKYAETLLKSDNKTESEEELLNLDNQSEREKAYEGKLLNPEESQKINGNPIDFARCLKLFCSKPAGLDRPHLLHQYPKHELPVTIGLLKQKEQEMEDFKSEMSTIWTSNFASSYYILKKINDSKNLRTHNLRPRPRKCKRYSQR